MWCAIENAHVLMTCKWEWQMACGQMHDVVELRELCCVRLHALQKVMNVLFFMNALECDNHVHVL